MYSWPRVIFLRGAQGAGKTTTARRILNMNENFYRVNRDELRHMLFGCSREWSDGQEMQVRRANGTIISMLLETGRSVVVDNTNSGIEINAAALALDDARIPWSIWDLITDYKTCLDRRPDMHPDTIWKTYQSIMIERHREEEKQLYKQNPIVFWHDVSIIESFTP